MSNLRFTQCNEMFQGITSTLYKIGKGPTKSYEEITPEDLHRIQQYFQHDIMNKPDPKKLQRCVLFNILYYFCQCGRENLNTMKINTFQTDIDSDGKQFVIQSTHEQDKNHGVENRSVPNQGRMHENPGKNILLSCLLQNHLQPLPVQT